MVIIATTKQILSLVLLVLGGAGAVWTWWNAPHRKRKRQHKADSKFEKRLRDVMDKENANEKLKKILDELNVSHHD